jgi:ATP-dependent Zn protease
VATTPERSDEELRATAYHEAGHAVITVVQGLTINKVSIVPGHDYNGICSQPGVAGYHYSNRREERSIARAIIIGLYAGMPAQRLVDPNPPAFHGQDDEDDAYELSRRHRVLPRHCDIEGDEYHLAYLERLRAEAQRLVRGHRWVIAKVAEELLQRQELDGAEAEELIESLPNP